VSLLIDLLVLFRQVTACCCCCWHWHWLQVTQQDIDAAIRQTGSSTQELLDVVFEEVHLQPG
jgi:hypothetical protein